MTDQHPPRYAAPFRHSSLRRLTVLALLAAIGMLSLSPLRADPASAVPGPPPWSAALSAGRFPPVYLTEWSKAENRGKCAVLVLADAEKEPGLKVRRADFYGGWAVAYDTMKLRSSFGIAGAGVEVKSEQEVTRFPDVIRWSDGSVAGYGLETGSDTDYLAFLKVEGQACLYNIWSKRGKAHLEHLLTTLRTVQPASKSAGDPQRSGSAHSGAP